MPTYRATFEVTAWDEAPFDAGDGVAKLTRASVGKAYSGDIEGESTTEWVMAYRPDESATFVGLERIRGVVGGREGTLVLQHIGEFEDGAATARLSVVAGTGSGALAAATGTGTFRADPAGAVTLELD